MTDGDQWQREIRIGFISFKFKYLQKVIHLTYLRPLSWCEMDCCLEVGWTLELSVPFQ